MFSSNQVLNITGDTEENLKKVLEYIFTINKEQAYGYSIINEYQCMVIYTDIVSTNQHYTPEKFDITMPIDNKDSTNIEYLKHLILMFLSSSNTKKMYQNLFTPGGDGSTHNGWEIVYSTDEFPSKVIIKPYTTFYHK